MTSLDRAALTLAVVVPTYRRPQELVRLLEALRRQSRPADDVVVVVHDEDPPTEEALQAGAGQGLPLRMVRVLQPGQVAALNAGFASCATDIVSVTDDDACPHPDWLRRIEQQIRWHAMKAESLPSWDGWPQLGSEEPRISRLLVVRRTRATRAVAAEFARQLRVAYPAHPDDALASLLGTEPWPGSALVWMVVEHGAARWAGGR